MCRLLDRFIAHPDARERHEIIVNAPAAFVLKTALNFDMQSVSSVRGIFWLRAKILGAKSSKRRAPIGLVEELLGLGWGKLGEEPEHYFCAGAVCQPWHADVAFVAVPRQEFAAYAKPGWQHRHPDDPPAPPPGSSTSSLGPVALTLQLVRLLALEARTSILRRSRFPFTGVFNRRVRLALGNRHGDS